MIRNIKGLSHIHLCQEKASVDKILGAKSKYEPLILEVIEEREGISIAIPHTPHYLVVRGVVMLYYYPSREDWGEFVMITEPLKFSVADGWSISTLNLLESNFRQPDSDEVRILKSYIHIVNQLRARKGFLDLKTIAKLRESTTKPELSFFERWRRFWRSIFGF